MYTIEYKDYRDETYGTYISFAETSSEVQEEIAASFLADEQVTILEVTKVLDNKE